MNEQNDIFVFYFCISHYYNGNKAGCAFFDLESARDLFYEYTKDNNVKHAIVIKADLDLDNGTLEGKLVAYYETGVRWIKEDEAQL